MNTATHHKNLDHTQWQQLSVEHQIGNIGSELTRVRVWEEKGDTVQYRRALERVIELLDMTVQGLSADHELMMLRDVVRDKLEAANRYQCSTRSLENYCLPFALLARKHV